MDTRMTPADERRPRRRRILLMLLTFGLALSGALGSAWSLALFTDTAALGGNAFTTGTIDVATSPASALVTYSNMMPGDTANGTLTVSNSGTAQLRYAMTSSSTNADAKGLRDVLTLTVKTIDVTTPATPCDNFDGVSTLYSGVLGAATAAFGSPTAGAQAGDRTLDAAASETLCFRVNLPSGTGNTYQNATTTATFTFDAEQTANNP